MLSLFVVALSFGSWTTAGLEQQDAIAIEFDGEISRPLLGRRFSTLTTPKPRKLIQDVADVQRTGFPNMEDKGERPYTYDDSRDDLYVSRSKGKGKGRPRKGGNPWDGSTGGRDDDEDGVPLRKLLLDGTCLKGVYAVKIITDCFPRTFCLGAQSSCIVA